jgi:allophanate hydrolase
LSFQAPAWHDASLVGAVQRLAGEVISIPDGWIRLAVAGAHLRGQPLEHQLVDRGALFVDTAHTEQGYRLVALRDTTPAKPGLARVEHGGRSIEVDVWALAPTAFADFVASIPSPLGVGKVQLSDGSQVCGFICEPAAFANGVDITHFGGWRSYLASLS